MNKDTGLDCLGVMWIVLITLKMMHLIDWTWLLVLAFPFIVTVVVAFIALVGFIILNVIDIRRKRKLAI